jgi:hypothetical protein
MKQHKWHKEIKAWADGAVIQTDISEVKEEPIWIDVHSPAWDINEEYRIKPQPKTPKQAWDEELTRSYKETIIERLRNDDKFYDEVFSAYDNAKDNEIKPQPKEPRYLYVYIGENDRYIFSMFHPSKYSNPECIGKIKLEDSE